MTDHRHPEPDDLYDALGVPAGASNEQITTAYRRLAREHHPDANPGADTDAFAGITDAYDVLRDPGRRRAYDDTRRARAQAASDATGVRIPIRRHIVQPDGSAPRPSGAARARPEAREIELSLSFEQAALGTIATAPIRASVTCPDCAGAGSNTVPCPSCAGTGLVARLSGGITVRSECPACGGRGNAPAATCVRCHGTGRAEVDRDVTVRVPPGIEAGQRLHVSAPGLPLELVAVARVATHPYFERAVNDLIVRLPITLAEAALGAVATLPTLDDAVAIRIPPGTRHGRTLRVRGRGIRDGSRDGDLLARVEIDVPTELSDAQRAALEAFAAATTSPRSHLQRPVGPFTRSSENTDA